MDGVGTLFCENSRWGITIFYMVTFLSIHRLKGEVTIATKPVVISHAPIFTNKLHPQYESPTRTVAFTEWGRVVGVFALVATRPTLHYTHTN
jgi:hypothetical protein